MTPEDLIEALGKAANKLSQKVIDQEEEIRKLKMEIEDYRENTSHSFKKVGYTSRLTVARLKRGVNTGDRIYTHPTGCFIVPMYIQE